MSALLLTAVIFTILWLWWRVLNWTLDLLERARQNLPPLTEPRQSGAEPENRREASDSS